MLYSGFGAPSVESLKNVVDSGQDAPATLPAPVRVVLLPVNIPDDKPELQWTSFATTVMLAESALAAPDLELVPLYESVFGGTVQPAAALQKADAQLTQILAAK